MDKIYHDNQRYRMHTISMSVGGTCEAGLEARMGVKEPLSEIN